MWKERRGRPCELQQKRLVAQVGGGDGDGGGGKNGGNYLALPSALARAKRSVWSARECVRVRVERDAEASQEPTTPPTTRPPACVDKKAHRCRRLEQARNSSGASSRGVSGAAGDRIFEPWHSTAQPAAFSTVLPGRS